MSEAQTRCECRKREGVQSIAANNKEGAHLQVWSMPQLAKKSPEWWKLTPHTLCV